ncbi:MAG: hypothetical protein SOW66_08495 [Porphyromonas sp.]|nr:hypothetical protein [Porphyromonas sp.]
MITRCLLWVIVLPLLCCVSLSAQTYSLDTLYFSPEDRVPIPKVSGEAYYLHAKPLRSPKTPGTKTRPGDWFNLNYSASNNFLDLRGPSTSLILIENRFIYEGNKPVSKYYKLYYKGDGEYISKEEFEQIHFSTMPQVRKLLAPYSLEGPQAYWKRIGELYRWQHPNLYVVAYDNERKGYYKYRIVLTIYHDHELSNSCGFH